jgi:hypothetical protein
MRQSMMTVMALVVFGAMVATAQAENQTPGVKRAASKVTVNSYDVCAKKALDLGFVPGQAGRAAYLDQCMGKTPAGRELDQETRGRLRCKTEGCAR